MRTVSNLKNIIFFLIIYKLREDLEKIVVKWYNLLNNAANEMYVVSFYGNEIIQERWVNYTI